MTASDEQQTLAMTSDSRAALGRAALDWCLQYFETIAGKRIYPTATAEQMQVLFEAPVPSAPQPLNDLMAQFAQIADNVRHTGPRMFGYVQSSGTFAGAIGDLLASSINVNVTSWRSAPSGATIERQTLAWIASMIGAPQHT